MTIFQWLVYRGHKTSSEIALNSTNDWCDILVAEIIRIASKSYAITLSFYKICLDNDSKFHTMVLVDEVVEERLRFIQEVTKGVG